MSEAINTALAVKPTNTIATYSKVQDPLKFAMQLATPLAAMLNCNEAQGQAAAMTCLCEGLTPIDFVRRYHLIQGKPSMRADAMLAEFRMNYGGQYTIVERSASRAAIKLACNGQEYAAEFTWDEAQESRWPWNSWKDHKKGFKDNWATPTDRKTMLWARLVSDSFRAFCPELVAGVYTPEELNDLPTGQPQVAPPTASEYLKQQAVESEIVSAEVVSEQDSAAEIVADSEVVDVPAAAESSESETTLVRTVRELFVEAFGDKASNAIEAALNNRNVNSFHNLEESDLLAIRDKLQAKISSGN